MADTKSLHAASTGPTEGDGVSYPGIVWFVVILVGTTVICQLLMWGLFAILQNRADAADSVRSPLAAPLAEPTIDTATGRVVPAGPTPGPNLLVNEPVALRDFRAQEDRVLSSYGWVDQNAGVVRIPIDEAKRRLLERGLPVRDPSAAPARPGGR